MQITMFERVRPAWPTKTKLRINGEGNRDDEWTFCRGKEADNALLFTGRKNGFTRVAKLRQMCSKYHICTILRKSKD